MMPPADLMATPNEAYFFVTEFTAPELKVPNITVGNVTHDGKFQMKNSELWGFGMSHFFNSRVNINGDIAFGSVDYDASWGDAKLSGRGDMFEGRLGTEILIIEGPLAPYVSGGIGYTSFDSGVPSGPPQVICWWDPWWGNVCSGYVETHHANEFTWNAGVGLRWHALNALVVKLSANLTWMKFGNAGTNEFPEYRLSVGWRW